MTGKERLIKALKCQKADRIPWVPFVGSHAASLLGIKASDYLKSSEAMIDGVSAAIERYQPDGIPVAFDLQIEAEALGCQLAWADDNPPAVVTHPLSNGTALADLEVPDEARGRIKTVIDTACGLRAKHPDVGLYGLVTGPFTLGLHLLGTDIFMRMFDNPDDVHKLMCFCNDCCMKMSNLYMEAGCDVIAVVDPMTSQIGPDQFVQFVSSYAAEAFEYIRSRGALSSFFVCGHAQQNIGVMSDCKCDNISIDENIPLQFVRDECRGKNISFGGNMQLTSVLLLGKPIDAQKNAVSCMETAGDEGFILAPGCDLPYATPPENIAAVTEVVHDVYKRDVVKTMASQSVNLDNLNLDEYGQADKVIIDIVTLDSEACAPCQYMVDAVKKVAPEFEGIVEWREHKIKYRESIVFMTSLMVRNVPTICIDGEITFVSRIPPRHELIAAIQKRINEKFRMKIRQKKATMYILGGQDEQTTKLNERIDQACRELGSDMEVQRIDDDETIASYGITSGQTPAVVIANYQLKSVKHIPEVVVIKEWLKNI